MMRKILQPGEHDHERINRPRLALLIVLVVCTGCLAATAGRIEWFKGAADPGDLHARIDRLQIELGELQTRQGQGVGAARVRLTCYMSEERQTDSTPWTTAINTACRPGIVAVSRDLLEEGWGFGRRVWIEGHGVYVIEDVMNARWKKSIDIWVPIGSRPFKHDAVLAVLVER